MRYLFLSLLLLLTASTYSQTEKPWPNGNWYHVYGKDTTFMSFSTGSYTVKYKKNQRQINMTGTVQRISDDIFEIIFSPEPNFQNQFLKVIDVQSGKLILQTGMFKSMKNSSMWECFPFD